MGCDYWVATNGSDTAAGSEAAPFATFQKGYDTLCPAAVGRVGQGGLHRHRPELDASASSQGRTMFSASMWIKSTRGGTSSNQLKFMAAPNATTRPILDFSMQPRLSAGANPDERRPRREDQRRLRAGEGLRGPEGERQRHPHPGRQRRRRELRRARQRRHRHPDRHRRHRQQRHEQHRQELRLVPQLRRGQRRRERRRLRHEGIVRDRQPVHRLPRLGERGRRLRLLRLDQPGQADGLLGARATRATRRTPGRTPTATGSSWAATTWAATTS